MNISIITPVLNEEQYIPPLLDSLAEDNGVFEHILIDGGSTDQTRQLIEQYQVTLLSSAPGRGTQQNAGAAAASGDILLFLHCDTRLPKNYQSVVRGVLESPGTVAGAFCLAIDHCGWAYRIIEKGANLRSRYLALPYGDQALFMKKKTFECVGGFPNQPILEELALLRCLRQIGNIHLAPAAVTTSARRWQKMGIFKTILINQMMLAGMLFGVSPQRLARFYLRDSESG